MTARSREINIIFPSGGKNRRGEYPQKEPPYTTPRAVNVRSVGPLEKRGRGGSRPGLVKFLDVDFGDSITAMATDDDGNRQQDLAVIVDGYFKVVRGSEVVTTVAYLATDDGDKIVDDNGNPRIFDSTVSVTNPLVDGDSFQLAERGGKLYIADSILKKYDPNTGSVITAPNAPTGQSLVCVYQERIVLSGADHMFYMSAQADDDNWDAGSDMDNVGRSVMGYVGDGGKIGEKINSVLPWRDKAPYLALMTAFGLFMATPQGMAGRNVLAIMLVFLGQGPYALPQTGLWYSLPGTACIYGRLAVMPTQCHFPKISYLMSCWMLTLAQLTLSCSMTIKVEGFIYF